MVGLRDAPRGHRCPRLHGVAYPTQYVGGPRCFHRHPACAHDLLVAALDAGHGLGRLVPNRQAVLGAGGVTVLGRASSIPEAAAQPLVPTDSAGDPFRQHCRGRGT